MQIDADSEGGFLDFLGDIVGGAAMVGGTLLGGGGEDAPPADVPK